MKNKNMTTINTVLNCTGCAACANICPKNAISMQENNEGFYNPVINKELCINCGLCTNICPEYNSVSKNTRTPKCYAAMANDDIRAMSSSGGAFTTIANEIFARGGVVCGAAFDGNWTVKHRIIDNSNDLHKLQGSKYVQSFVSEYIYRSIKKYLEEGTWVIFSGTPCQVAGLKAYLKKNYENLLLVDLICSKVPSKTVFDKYLTDNNLDKRDILNINFRNKANGWNCSTTTTTTTTTTTHSKYWFRAFLNGLIMNESCISCKYMSIDRVGDLTIGDFWGVKDFDKEMDDNKGTSVILVNNSKGEKFFNNLKWNKCKKMTTEQAIHGNRALLVPFIPHQNRKLFTEQVKNTDFTSLVDICLSNKYNVAILNWWWNSNRGAILTCYALQELVKSFGYSPSIIKCIPFNYYHKEYKGSVSEKFAEKYLNLTNWCHSRIDMRNLNEYFSTFIVGSDQVWNYNLNYLLQDFYYLNFVELNKNKISCAASFGLPDYTGNNTITKMFEYYLKRFNSVSVREKDAINILNNKFNTNGVFILDPVFLVNKQKYIDISNTTAKTDTDYIAYYFLHDNKNKNKYLEQISQKMKLPVVNIKEDTTVEDWLYYIKNAKLVISDSFHASCFSIIFNTKFLTLHFKKNSRFDTLSDLTNLHHRFVLLDNFDIKNLEVYLRDENWEQIEKNMQSEKQRSVDWLKNAVQFPEQKVYTSSQEYLEAFYASFDDRLNYLEGKCSKIISIFEIDNALNKYKKYKFLSKICFGNLRKSFKSKKEKYENILNNLLN